MRCFVFATILAFSSVGMNATAQEGVEGPAPLAPSATLINADLSNTVTITPIAAPAQIIEQLSELSFKPENLPAKKIKTAKKTISKSLFTRSERQQMALVADKPGNSEQNSPPLADDEEGDSGADDIDMHRSFSRPQVSKVAEQHEGDEDPLMTDTVKLRLFLARMKAVQAHEKKYG